MDRYSKTLTWLLRHAVEEMGLHMSEDGYVCVDELLALNQLAGCSEETIREIVKKDSKTRFSLREEENKIYIRANQGHSGKVAKQLDPEKYTKLILQPIHPCIHGTYSRCLESIKKKGLMVMDREYIHCAAGLPHEVKSGMRTNCDVFIYIDMKKAMADGIEFRLSDNGVILTKGVNGVLDPKYFNIVIKF